MCNLSIVNEQKRDSKTDVGRYQRGSWWWPFLTRKDLAKLIRVQNQIMIAQATLDSSAANLAAAVKAAVDALATNNTATSTPDTVVAAYQAEVDALTVSLAAGTPPAAQ